MRAVNLIPSDARRSGHANVRSLKGPGSAVIGLLVVVLVMVVLYVMASKDVSSAQGRMAGLQQQLSQTQELAGKLNGYTQFAQLAKARVDTVRQIASGRFDWQRALSDLSRVVPANTTLSSLAASVSPSDSAGTGGSSGGLRGDITAPAFEMTGCTATQDDVARLMSRLRLMRGVTRVTLSNSVKGGGSSSSVSTSSSGSAPAGCGANAPTFDLVVFFTPLAATAASTTGVPGAPASTGPTGPTGTTGSTQ